MILLGLALLTLDLSFFRSVSMELVVHGVKPSNVVKIGLALPALAEKLPLGVKQMASCLVFAIYHPHGLGQVSRLSAPWSLHL